MAVVAVVTGCGAGGTPPNQAVSDYVNALSEADFASACAMLPAATRASFAKSIGPRVTCVQAFGRCVPRRPTNSSQDQTQLLYANVQTNVTGSTAVASISGTVVARAVKQVNLIEHRGVWSLSSYGEGLKQCALAAHRARRGSVPLG
jgi:hypothetical protein